MHYFPYRDHTPFPYVHRPDLTLSFPLLDLLTDRVLCSHCVFVSDICISVFWVLRDTGCAARNGDVLGIEGLDWGGVGGGFFIVWV